MNTHLDERDLEILVPRKRAFNRRTGPRVGDYLRRKSGSMSRITYIWPEHVQDGGVGGSYYLGDGYLSYSGGLNPGIPTTSLRNTGEHKEGWVWFFHHDWATADNGVHARMKFRIFEEVSA